MSFESVGLSALRAAQIGLSTAGHNIANASTPGYHRQGLIQSNAFALKTGAGFIGQGVNVDTVRRQISSYIETQLKQVQTTGAQLDSFLSQIEPIDNAVGGSNSGLAVSLEEFFKSVADVSSNPASVPSRQALLSGGSALVSKLQSLATRFSEVRDGLDTQISDSVQLINSYGAQIANLNNQIALQSAGNPNQLPNDLMDQREQLISLLNKEVGTSVITQSDGSVSVFFGSGQPLVIRDTVFTLAAVAGREDAQHLEVDYQFNSTTNIPIGSNNISGGRLGGLLAFRDQSLDVAENSLGRIAMAVATAFNDQHALGQDLAGNAGGNFFTVGTGNVLPGTANAGTGVVTTTLANIQHVTTSDYRLVATAAGYTLTRLSDSTQTAITAAQLAAGFTVDGITLQLAAGATVVGDTFLVRPTRNGASGITMASGISTTTIAAASPITTLATLGNFGNGKISAGSVNSPNDKVTITFTGAGTFTATDNTTGAPLIDSVSGTTTFAYVSGSNISINGWTAQISGAAVVGDVFQVDKGVTSKTASGGGSTAAINNAIISVSPLNANLRQNVTITYSNITSAGTAAAAVVPTGAATVAAALAAITAVAVTGAGGTIALAATGAAIPASLAQANKTAAAVADAARAAAAITGATAASVEAAAQAAATAGFLEYNVTGTGSGIPSGPLAYDTISGAAISYNGWSAKLTGTPQNGDTFTVGPTTSGTADNRNALALAQLESLSTMSGGTSSFQGSYAQMVSLIGNKTSEIKVTGAAQKELVQQTQATQQSVSGVNLDEEAADLLRFQQAYQAAGKMFEISNTLFNSILAAVQ
ncbi:MAG: flagellar hook-associated protein FlgK [Methylophilales bacterium]|nr:flagellar hook-associated protein FlgK [Methylophilales bacterium]